MHFGLREEKVNENDRKNCNVYCVVTESIPNSVKCDGCRQKAVQQTNNSSYGVGVNRGSKDRALFGLKNKKIRLPSSLLFFHTINWASIGSHIICKLTPFFFIFKRKRYIHFLYGS